MLQASRFTFEAGGPQRLEVVDTDEGKWIVVVDRVVLTPTPLVRATLDATLLLDDGSELSLRFSESRLFVSRDEEPLTGTECDLNRVAAEASRALTYPTLMLVVNTSAGYLGGTADVVTALQAPYLVWILGLGAVVGAGYRLALLAGAALLIAFALFDAVYRGMSWQGLAVDAVAAVSLGFIARAFRAMAPIQRWYPSRLLPPGSPSEKT